MNRLLNLSLVAAASVLLGACSIGASAGAPTASPSANARQGARNGAAGELVKISGTTLVVNSANGDVTVVYSDSTLFLKTSTGSFADILAGTCMIATGQKDATGAVTAATVRLSDKVNGACQAGGPGGPGAGPQGTPPPTPQASPRANRANFSFVAGEVTSVAGTTITVKNAAGTLQTVTVPTTVRVTKSASASASDLALHQCLTAAGSKDSSGKVTARAISIVPAGPSGCSTGGRGFFGGGGFGGGGGGGFGGGGGGGFGGGGAAPPKD
ncbi:MAG TPA: hypothetical protein VNV65_00485 [Candidatus Solibacter sp.]|nr:hypothetical protein [Candidatus Solibacter sp.]